MRFVDLRARQHCDADIGIAGNKRLTVNTITIHLHVCMLS